MKGVTLCLICTCSFHSHGWAWKAQMTSCPHYRKFSFSGGTGNFLVVAGSINNSFNDSFKNKLEVDQNQKADMEIDNDMDQKQAAGQGIKQCTDTTGQQIQQRILGNPWEWGEAGVGHNGQESHPWCPGMGLAVEGCIWVNLQDYAIQYPELRMKN